MAVSGGHEVYWERAGNPAGIPAIVLHGGPGSGCRSGHYDLFDLDRYCVTLMDQRGAGRSRPSAAVDIAALDLNTTDDLLSDIEALRILLDVDKWVVFGGSWGSSLGLIYTQAYRSRVRAMVLAGVATTARRDLAWLYQDIGNLFPEAHDAFCAFVPEAADVWARIAAYNDALRDPARAQAAADAWCTWELAIFDADFDSAGGKWVDPGFRVGFARVCTHYFRNFCFRDDNAIEAGMAAMADVPGVMIHSRFDPSCPLRAPWELAKLWPAARLEVLGGNAHSALAEEMVVRIRAATDGFAQA